MQEMSNAFAEKCKEIDEMARVIREMELSTKKKEEILQEVNDNVDEKCQKISEMNMEITEMLLKMKRKDDLVEKPNINIAEREQQLKGMAIKKAKLQTRLKEKDEMIQTLKRTVSEKEQQLKVMGSETAEVNHNLAEKNGKLQEMDATAARMAMELSSLQDNMKEKDELLKVLNVDLDKSKEQTEVRSREVQRLNECISDRNAQIETLTEESLKLKENISRLEHELLEKRKRSGLEIEGAGFRTNQETEENLADGVSCQATDGVSSTTKTPLPTVQSTISSTPTLKHVIRADDESSVVGVTSVDSRLFVLRSPCQQRIQVYDLKNFTLQHTLKVQGLTDTPFNGLTACDTNKYLYVSDWCNAFVYQVDLQLTDGNEISKWSVGNGPTGLSINIVCNLLVTCCEDNKIQEYNTASGSLIREICLKSNDSELFFPYHAIQLTSGQVVVSCLSVNTDVNTSEFDVVEADDNGRVVVSYKSQMQSTTDENFSFSRALAVDDNEELILVADLLNNRIVTFRRSLNCHASEMSVECGLDNPSCLHFSKSQRRLIVGEGRTIFNRGQRRVLVFDSDINNANSSKCNLM